MGANMDIAERKAPSGDDKFAGSLDAKEERRMDNRTKVRSEERVRIARERLRLAQDDLKTAQQTRLYYVRLGRGYGMTWAAIGDALGLSDGAAKMIVRRAGDS